MNEKVKNYLGFSIIASLLIFAVSAAVFVRSYSKSLEPTSFRSFSVSGEGKVIAVPDIAKFSFSIITQGGKNISELQKENTEKNNKAISFLKSNGVEAKDMKTESYNLEPRYQYFSCPGGVFNGAQAKPCPPPEIVGYTITQTAAVKIRDFTKIGDLLSGVIQNGANTVSQLSFIIDDLTILEDQARAQAISKAKEKAKTITKAGGFKLGRLLAIEEGGIGPTPIYRLQTLEAGDKGGELPAPSIEPGSQEVTVNVILKYEIK